MGALLGGPNRWRLARWAALVPKIGELEPELQALSDHQLRKRSLALRYRAKSGEPLRRLQADKNYPRFITEALDAAPEADFIYLHHEIVLAADRAGFDMIGAVHEAGRKVDAWTIQSVDFQSLSKVERLLALKADQITTDDPEGLAAALAS